MHRGQHTFAQTTRRFYRLAVQDAVFHVGDVPGHTRLLEVFDEVWPKSFFRAFFGVVFRGVVVETAAAGTARALEFFHHFFDENLPGRCQIGLAFGLKILARLFRHMQAQGERRFINHGQRPHRHAALHARVFDGRRGDAF